MFDPLRSLKRSTGRAKSDVANKLVSMLLHAISKAACKKGGMSISDSDYIDAVSSAFGGNCLYCGRILERDRTAVEHLHGMNRFRLGLHIPGNVALACRKCNTEKRRDDQTTTLILAPTGWESFLSHDNNHCEDGCKTCAYWEGVWPDQAQRSDNLSKANARVHKFQSPFSHFNSWAVAKTPLLRELVEEMYRSCQDFAEERVNELTATVDLDFDSLIRP